jgi:hypothetical protein
MIVACMAEASTVGFNSTLANHIPNACLQTIASCKYALTIPRFSFPFISLFPPPHPHPIPLAQLPLSRPLKSPTAVSPTQHRRTLWTQTGLSETRDVIIHHAAQGSRRPADCQTVVVAAVAAVACSVLCALCYKLLPEGETREVSHITSPIYTPHTRHTPRTPHIPNSPHTPLPFAPTSHLQVR